MFDLRWGLKLHTSMSFRATTLKRSHLLTLLLGLVSLPVWGQAADSPVTFANVGAITATLVDTPSVSMSNGNSSSPRSGSDAQWLKVEFRFDVTPAAGSFLDAVEFKIWIEGIDLLDPQGKQGEGVAVALTGSVTYVAIAQGKDNYGVFYVPPSILKRYSKLGASDFDRKFNIHIDATVGGKVADFFNKNKETDADWYKSLKPVAGMVYRQDQCIFAVVDPGRYPAIKVPAENN